MRTAKVMFGDISINVSEEDSAEAIERKIKEATKESEEYKNSCDYSTITLTSKYPGDDN